MQSETGALDFFLGQITREHENIDLFVWARDISWLTRQLRRAGFDEPAGPPPEAQRNFMKDGEELQIALLDRNRDGEIVVAGGPWAGAPWPEGMLNGSIGRIDGLACPIVNPRVQIEIKEQFRDWRPDVPVRDKHRAEVARLHAALDGIEE